MNSKIIRFRRKGRRYLYRFDIVVCYRFKRSRGDFLEKIGFFDFISVPVFNINGLRLGYWLNKGAILHPSVRKYLVKLVFFQKKYD